MMKPLLPSSVTTGGAIPDQRAGSGRRGVVLFVVTIVIAMASLAAYGFVLTMQSEHKAARASADQLQVAQVAYSGEEFMAAWLQTSPEARWSDREMYGDALFAQQVTEPATTEIGAPTGQFYIVTPAQNEEAQSSQAGSLAPSNATQSNRPFQYGPLNESGKLHLQTLLAWDEQWPGSGRNALLQLPGMTESIADAILDWVDNDDVAREFGAEYEYYQSLPQPYTPTNSVPRSLDDLWRVRGVTKELLFGNGMVPLPAAAELASTAGPIAGPSAESFIPWQSFLTVYSAERNESFDGQPRIYVNGEDLASLHRALAAQLPRELADFLILYRQYGPAAESEDVSEADQISVDLSQRASHQLASTAELVNAVVILPASSGHASLRGSSSSNAPSRGSGGDDDTSRRVMSPLSTGSTSTGSASAGQFDPWLDRLTVCEDDVIVGRLNVFAARPEVIRGLPLLDPAAATEILARGSRTNGGAAVPSTASATPGISWLVTEGLIGVDEFRQLAPYLTAGGDVARFQIVATHAERQLHYRSEVILDATVENTQRVYFRDLRRSGTPELFEMFYQQSDPAVAGTLTSPSTANSP